LSRFPKGKGGPKGRAGARGPRDDRGAPVGGRFSRDDRGPSRAARPESRGRFYPDPRAPRDDRGPRGKPKGRAAEASGGRFDPTEAAGAARAFQQGTRRGAEARPREVPRRVEGGPREFGDDRYVYGVNPVLELLRARPKQVDRVYVQQQGLKESISGEIFARARDENVRVDYVERDRLNAMIPQAVHQGVIAEVRQFDYSTLEAIIEAPKRENRPGLVVVLDGIQDPMNLGAIVRSAHAFGADGIIIPKDRAAAVTGVVAKASAGASAHTRIARVTNISRAIEQLKQEGYWTVAAQPDAKESLFSARLDGSLVIVVGAEGPGVRKGVLEHCDFLVRIPMSGQVASLNASVSAALLLAEVSRRRLNRPVRPAVAEVPVAEEGEDPDE